MRHEMTSVTRNERDRSLARLERCKVKLFDPCLDGRTRARTGRLNRDRTGWTVDGETFRTHFQTCDVRFVKERKREVHLAR